MICEYADLCFPEVPQDQAIGEDVVVMKDVPLFLLQGMKEALSSPDEPSGAEPARPSTPNPDLSRHRLYSIVGGSRHYVSQDMSTYDRHECALVSKRARKPVHMARDTAEIRRIVGGEH
jgi:hypothetical protein